MSEFWGGGGHCIRIGSNGGDPIAAVNAELFMAASAFNMDHHRF
jgi:hypothetical protein